jgi:DNA-binding transcriptional ArsR family regulator
MVAAANLVEVAALVGDTARATMLGALMSGQSLTGGELAFLAHVSRSTASEHLTKLVEARLIAVTRRRRFQLLPHCLAAGGADAGKYQSGRRHRGAAALSATFDAR